ncbi:MAG: CoA transferase [Treponema sp.]|jgi:cinnamoyl-CoA:phenyllactate CoA-transferase|nr:CoA transferase [Treponema sp.]
MNNKKRPLEGIKVLELATFIAGPCCARYLADLGAEVVKVEPPGGDPLRFTAVNEGRPFGDAEDTTFCMENTGKKCIALNTKSDAGRKVLEQLLAESDIFITNWRQGALERAGLDYKTIHEKYPKIVMGFVSGYGEKGPDKDLPGFDFTAYFARGGIMGTLYDKDGSPMIPIAGFGDHQVGIYLAGGVIAALYRARETGRGDQVVVSLFHTAIWDVGVFLSGSQYGDSSTKYPVSRKKIANQLQVAHRTKDGYWVQIAMPRYDFYYPKFCPVIDRADLIDDPRFFPQTSLQEHLDEFYAIVDEGIRRLDLTELEKRMNQADLPYAVCQTWDQLLEDKQAWGSDALAKVKFPNGKERAMVRTPVMFTETGLPPYERGRFLGEDTREVLARLGYTAGQIDAMIAAGDITDLKRIG